MKVVIAKVDENLFDGEAAYLSVPSVGGILGILPNHEPFITTLKEGIVVVRLADETEQEFRIDGGVLEVHKDGATVIL
ncbi:MAG TPA: F0F1 ATP synthase subunit epsilon [Candidatus Paceibacterota bacterium]